MDTLIPFFEENIIDNIFQKIFKTVEILIICFDRQISNDLECSRNGDRFLKIWSISLFFCYCATNSSTSFLLNSPGAENIQFQFFIQHFFVGLCVLLWCFNTKISKNFNYLFLYKIDAKLIKRCLQSKNNFPMKFSPSQKIAGREWYDS